MADTPATIPEAANPTKGEAIGKLLEAFEAAAKADDDGVQYWFARELAPMLGYARWENFSAAIERARMSCTNSGENCSDHFRDITKLIPAGKGARQPIADVELTRFACYLIAMSGDPAKSEIAAAQTYFAVQTRRQEIADQAASQLPPMTEDQRRVLLRDEMKTHNKSLSSAAARAGVKTPLEYAIFKNEGYKGLYGGLDRVGIQRRKRLTNKQNILDHMPSSELASNLFVATQTEEKLRRDNVQGKDEAGKLHHGVGCELRAAIAKIGGTMPEKYPAVEDVKEARKRIKAEAKEAAKLTAPPKERKPPKKKPK